MAINYLNTVNLNKNQLEQAAIQNLTADPSSGVLGQIYYNTVSDVLKVCVTANVIGPPAVNAVWQEVGGGIEGGGTVNTIPKFGPTSDFIGDSSITDDGTTVNFSGSLISLDDAADADAIISAPGKLFIELDNDNSGTDERFEIRTTVSGTKAARLSIDASGNTAVTGTFLASGNTTIGGDIGIGAGTIELRGNDTRVIKGYDIPEVAGNTPGLDIITGALSGTNTAGTDLTLSAAQGTGTGNGGNIVFKVATPSGTSGSTSNALATAMTISGVDGDVLFANGIQVDGDSIIYGELTMDNVIAMSNNKITGLLDPEDAQDAATKSYVDTAVVGSLQFKGGFDADTGTIDGGTTNLTYNGQPAAGDETVPLVVGDYYVVTGDGDFFGNTATPLTVGDSVIVKDPADAGDSDESYFVIVQSDTDLATASTVGLGNVAAGTGISVAYSNGTATVTATANGVRQDLLSSDSNVTRTESGGLTTFALDVGAILGSTSALDVKAEIISAAGQTVYADITRSGTTLNVIFTGSVADSDYQALLIDLA